MALALSKVLPCPTSQFSRKNFFFKVSLSNFPSASVRICRTSTQDERVVCASSSAAGSSSSDRAFNPYQVLGVNPIEGFEEIKAAYTRKCKDAERRGDEATAAQLEKAYDKIMMAQLMNRKKGVTFGSFQEDGEDEGRIWRMVKRLLRSIALVAGCIAVSSMGYNGLLNLIEFVGNYIPSFLYENQELFITASTAILLHFLASYYR